MTYLVKSSEHLRPTAAETETKALLYLMNFREDSEEVYYFVVDFFNDLTGMSRMADKMWDVQSKGVKNSSPKMIGKELVTLYKNYLSNFEFSCFILFLGGVSNTLRLDNDISSFSISNIKGTALKKIVEGLKEECTNKTYISDEKITDDKINDFLNKVYFVIDNKEKSEYVKKIIRFNPSFIPKDEVLIAIFNEIMNTQSGKKNNKVVENTTLSFPSDAISYGRHLTVTEIKLLVLNRILTQKVVGSVFSHSFKPVYYMYPEEDRKNLLEDCQLDFSKALFDTASQDDYWKLFEEVYRLVINNPNDDINIIFDKLDKGLKNKCRHFNVLSLKYFIAKVKDGLELC
ncbi:hypothetical protein KQ873_02870 [Mycoplasma zalophidermidis]|nr:hypothetical protein [Mycoplasma zalophidermidis]